MVEHIGNFNLNSLLEGNIILGFPIHFNLDIALNVCIIIAKYFIYTSKLNQTDLLFMNYLEILKGKLIIEETVHAIKGQLDRFHVVWGSLQETIMSFCLYLLTYSTTVLYVL